MKKFVIKLLSICILICVFVVIQVNTIEFRIFAEFGSEENQNIINDERGLEIGDELDNPINILEIEPGDLFKLTKTGTISIDFDQKYNRGKGVMPLIETIQDKIKGKFVKVEHITMPEFISRVDELNGRYDIVVIGRSIIREYLDREWYVVNMGLSNTIKYNERKYFDYSNPMSIKITDIEGSGNKSFPLPNIWSPSEYYSENDLTERRLRVLEDYIDSGQLLYIDQNIGKDFNINIGTMENSQAEENKSIKNTNLYRFYTENDKSNFKKISLEDITLDKIVEDYCLQNHQYKRPYIKNQNINPIINNNNIEFSFSIPILQEVTFNLYIDKDGDGQYKEDEKVIKEYEPICENEKGDNNFKNYHISYNLGEQFWGYLGWKVEVVNEKNIRSSFVGSYNINSNTNNKKEIKVLHLMKNKYDGSENVFSSPRFQELYNQTDYNIVIDKLQFDELASSIINNPNKLDEYNSIVIGFSTGGNDYYKDSPGKIVIDSIKEFIKSGKTIVFTNFTMTDAKLLESLEDNVVQNFISSNELSSNDYERIYNTYPLTKYFRDIIGQARYMDPFNKNGKDLNGKEIKHSKSSNYTDKANYQAGLSLAKDMGNLGGNNSYVRLINESQLSNYPFKLDNKDKLNNIQDGKYIKISSSWNQRPVYQLNLEAEDLVPIFNYGTNGTDNNSMNIGDSRNYYYTYMKGNILFSISPLKNNSYTDEELKLFINVMVKNPIQANNPPIIESNYNDENNNEVIMVNNSIIELPTILNEFRFTTKAFDSDGDKVKLTVKVDGNTYTCTNDFLSASELNISISITKLVEVFNRVDKNLKIEIEAEDEKGAKSNEWYTLDLSNVVIELPEELPDLF